jgi:hypothetical protein
VRGVVGACAVKEFEGHRYEFEFPFAAFPFPPLFVVTFRVKYTVGCFVVCAILRRCHPATPPRLRGPRVAFNGSTCEQRFFYHLLAKFFVLRKSSGSWEPEDSDTATKPNFSVRLYWPAIGVKLLCQCFRHPLRGIQNRPHSSDSLLHRFRNKSDSFQTCS